MTTRASLKHRLSYSWTSGYVLLFTVHCLLALESDSRAQIHPPVSRRVRAATDKNKFLVFAPPGFWGWGAVAQALETVQEKRRAPRAVNSHGTFSDDSNTVCARHVALNGAFLNIVETSCVHVHRLG